MNIINLDQIISMTSLEIAELTGKEHKHVMRDIRKMVEELNGSNFGRVDEETYKDAKGEMLRDRNEISVLKVGKVSQMVATKFATLQYAGWVSLEFSMMVYAAFESILEMPEVATVVANKMVELGYQKETELLERHTNADRDYAHAHAEMKRWRDTTTNKSRCSAVLAGHISLQTAVSQGLKGVWLERCRAGLEAMGDY